MVVLDGAAEGSRRGRCGGSRRLRGLRAAELVDAHEHRHHRVHVRAEAEDLVQTALLGAYSRWRRVRPDEALAYLRRSILNANVSRWRRHRGAEMTVDEPPDTARPDSAEQAVDDRGALLPLLRALPQRQRSVLVLRYLCDLPDRDIAATLGISAGTVRSQASRGLATLRACHRIDVPDHEVSS